ncbi:MAG: antitoxin family protein, partial [Gammaproteobacteria bacterium]
MVETLEAIFDGKVLRPERPLTLEPNTRVRITIETAQPVAEKVTSFLR